MLQDQLVQVLAVDQNVKVIVLAGIGGGLLFFWILFSNVTKMVREKERELTKRDLAAYVAEGSIAPEDAVKIANAGGDEFADHIKQQLASGIISQKKAEKLLEFHREART